jgi:hypothetical protein
MSGYRQNRGRLIAMLQQAGLTRFAPAEGAFYLYVDVSALTRDSVEFCRRLLAETGVAVAPGRDFADPRRQLDPPLVRRLSRGHRGSLLAPRPLAPPRPIMERALAGFYLRGLALRPALAGCLRTPAPSGATNSLNALAMP